MSDLINARQSLKSVQQGDDINIAPLIDLIFLLLIFFMVTTSFVKETGIDVDRPSAATARVQEKGNILIGVSADGGIYMDKKSVDVRMVRARVESGPIRQSPGVGNYCGGSARPGRYSGGNYGPVPDGRCPQRQYCRKTK